MGRVIGIDLGTTNSVVAVVEGDRFYLNEAAASIDQWVIEVVPELEYPQVANIKLVLNISKRLDDDSLRLGHQYLVYVHEIWIVRGQFVVLHVLVLERALALPIEAVAVLGEQGDCYRLPSPEPVEALEFQLLRRDVEAVPIGCLH